MSTVAQKQEIKKSFEKIQLLTDKVCLLLQHQSDYFVWLDYRAEPRLAIVNPIERLEYVLRLVTLQPEQKAKTVVFCPGFIAASPTLFDAILELNAAKKDFQQRMVGLRKDLLKIQEATLDNQFGNPSHERPQIVHQFLVEIELEHIHFKHVYRCFPIMQTTPKQLGWTWAHTQSIKTITREQAIFLLEKRNNEGRYDAEIEKVKALSEDQKLSIRQKLAPHLRVNVLDQNDKRSMLKGTLPVVFLRGEKLPLIRPAKEKIDGQPQSRLSRKDKKTSDVPFIPAIRAYLSKPEEAPAETSAPISGFIESAS